jgi:hypothetical protein
MDTTLLPSLIISAIALFAVIYIIIQVLIDLNLYSNASGFPTPTLFFIGTLVSFCALGSYVAIARKESCEHLAKPSSSIVASSLFYLFYWLFVLNLTVRAEYFVNGARLPITSGAFWLFLALCVLLFVLAYDQCSSGRWLLFVPIIWMMFLAWNWVYKI